MRASSRHNLYVLNEIVISCVVINILGSLLTSSSSSSSDSSFSESFSAFVSFLSSLLSHSFIFCSSSSTLSSSVAVAVGVVVLLLLSSSSSSSSSSGVGAALRPTRCRLISSVRRSSWSSGSLCRSLMYVSSMTRQFSMVLGVCFGLSLFSSFCFFFSF